MKSKNLRNDAPVTKDNAATCFRSQSITPAAVEELFNETPVDHSNVIESMKKSIDELEEALHCLKHEIKQLKSTPVQELIVAPAPVEESNQRSSLRK